MLLSGGPPRVYSAVKIVLSSLVEETARETPVFGSARWKFSPRRMRRGRRGRGNFADARSRLFADVCADIDADTRDDVGVDPIAKSH